MWENEHSKHTKVLFHIKWDHFRYHYYLNAGAFDTEKEVLLVDGTKVSVESVEEVKKDGLFLHTLITLAKNLGL